MKMKNPPLKEGFSFKNYLLLDLRKDTLFLEGTNRVGAEYHRYLLSVDSKRLLLQIRLEYPACATQRKADIVAELLSLAGEFTL